MKRFIFVIMAFLLMTVIGVPEKVMAVDDDVGIEMVSPTVSQDNAAFDFPPEMCVLPGGLELKLPLMSWTATIDILQPTVLFCNSIESQTMTIAITDRSWLNNNGTIWMIHLPQQIHIEDLTRLDIGEHYKC